MTSENHPTGASESLDHLLKAFAELPEPATEELREVVKAMGIDPDEAILRVRKLMAAKAEEARLAWRAEEEFRIRQLWKPIEIQMGGTDDSAHSA